MSKPFKERVKNRETLITSLVTLAGSDGAEILARSGFDWIWIEMEHSAIDLGCAQQMIRAVGPHCPCVVRAPWNDPAWTKRILDLGCDGIIIPQINTPLDAERAIRSCKYPPTGDRGVGVARAQGYGMEMQKYVATANEKITIILQIEHVEGVRQIDSILKVADIDGVFVGPYDLSGSLGMMGQLNEPSVQKAVNTIKDACDRANVPIGIFAPDLETARKQIKAGFSLVAIGTDGMFLWKTAKQIVEGIKGG
jgi:2-dehydro-3-deoxyglucarate aldolase/4-hydroxy-2-oxoheptanedioate aldolase